VSVRPDYQGVGVGRALIEWVVAWAAQAGMPAVTLTTFVDVPWNAPLYRRLGFRGLAEYEIGPELRAIQETEAAHGLDPATRVACAWRSPAADDLHGAATAAPVSFVMRLRLTACAMARRPAAPLTVSVASATLPAMGPG
jgi:predicted N-acetyltransferase YhbS